MVTALFETCYLSVKPGAPQFMPLACMFTVFIFYMVYLTWFLNRTLVDLFGREQSKAIFKQELRTLNLALFCFAISYILRVVKNTIAYTVYKI